MNSGNRANEQQAPSKRLRLELIACPLPVARRVRALEPCSSQDEKEPLDSITCPTMSVSAQSVLGTAAAHSRVRDGSTPSAATRSLLVGRDTGYALWWRFESLPVTSFPQCFR